MVLLISYDLVGRERPSSYKAVKEYIERHAIDSIRPLYSQWFIQTNSSPDQWAEGLVENNLIDSDDRLFICRVQRPYQGWLPDAHWEWLKPRL